jgi:hypothetical protein
MAPDGLFVAPAQVPPGGVVRVRASSVADPGLSAEVAIAIDPVPAVVPATGALPTARRSVAPLSRPTVTRNRRIIVLRTVPRVSGTLKVAAIRGGVSVARCRVTAIAGRRATCKLRRPARLATARVRISVSLSAVDGTRAGARLSAAPRG